MKTILTLFVFCAFYSQAQNEIYSEDFEGGVISTTWINNDLLTSSFGGYTHPDSGWIVMGEGYYLYGNAGATPTPANKIATSTSMHTPSGFSDDWLLTPLISIPADCYFMWSTRGFRPWASAASVNSYEVWISITGTNLTDYTTQLHAEVWPPYEWKHNYVDLSAYSGQTISIAIRNVSVNAQMLGVDKLRIVELESYDMAGVDVTTKIGVKQSVDQSITGHLRNYGTQSVTSMDLNYRINGGATVTENLIGLAISPMEEYEYSHGTLWNPAAVGSALIEVWASNINGNTDLLMSNDIASRTVEVYQDMTLRRPMYEDLSSKECSPCKSWNTFIHPIIDDQWNANLPAGNISAVYYQTSFPGDPDPSNNNDSDLRWAYYGYGGTPQNYVDGVNSMNSTIFDEDWNTPATYTDYAYGETPSFMGIDVSASWNGLAIDVTVDVNPLKDFTSNDLKLQIIVAEAHYSDSAGFNGETEFYYVMRKMLPNGVGTSIGPLTQYNNVQVSESYSFTLGNVVTGSYNLWEGIHNTQIIAFVQDGVTMEIHQSGIALDYVVGVTETDELRTLIYPNPATEQINVDFNADLEDQVRISILDINGRLMSSDTYQGVNKVQLPVDALPAGIYFIKVEGESINQMEKVIVQ